MTTATVNQTMHHPTVGGQPMKQSDVGQWPSLGSSLKTGTDANDEWEMIASPPISSRPAEVTFDSDAIFLKANSAKCTSQRSHDEDGHDFDSLTAEDKSAGPAEDASSMSSSSGFLLSEAPSVASWPTASSSKLSFRDAILLKQKESAKTSDNAPNPNLSQPRLARKFKPKFVVTPIKRCAKSASDLQSIAIDEDDEILGASDAKEYYGRKAQGYSGRMNGLKTRPDEAKRRQLIINKKNVQRQKQASRKR